MSQIKQLVNLPALRKDIQLTPAGAFCNME